MDYENERYVRVYTRDTADLLAVRWEGRAVLWEMTRKADRAGVIEGDQETLPELLRMPPEVVEAGLARLLDRRLVELGELDGQACYLIRDHIEAQEARQSDRQRQRECRARRREQARAGWVTERDEHRDAHCDNTSHAVTIRDEPPGPASHGVTPSLALPSLAEPSEPARRARPRVAEPMPKLAHEGDAGGDQRILALARAIAAHPKLSCLRPEVHVAQELLGGLGSNVAKLDPQRIPEAVALAVAKLETGAVESRCRTVIGWKLSDAIKAGPAREEVSEAHRRYGAPEPPCRPETPEQAAARREAARIHGPKALAAITASIGRLPGARGAS